MDSTEKMETTPEVTATSTASEKSLPELLDAIYLDTTPAVDVDICKIISKRVKDKEITLLGVVEELGSRLTSTYAQERSKAVEILAHVFTHLPNDFLTEKELTFLVDFLCDRCKDQHLVIPKIILCVLPIVKCKNLPSGAGSRLLDALFQEANIQSHIHKIRQTFFKILHVLLLSDKHVGELQTSPDFIMNFLQSMDGEKDPRNLLILFRIIPTIISKFKLDPFTEDFFEILSCYFPVDFNPTVSVPGEEVITRQDLGRALNTCLSQTNEFSEFMIPLAMEKLESNSIDAKLDSLELLELCCERSYQPKDLEPYLGQIWHAMRQEIFMGGNDDVEKKCYGFLKAAFTMISKDTEILKTCLTMIYTECKHHLSEPELRLILPTSNILGCITESGKVACSSVIQNMFPVIYQQICTKAAKSEKKRLLEIWETLIRTSHQYKGIEYHVLVPNWDEMRALWFTLLTNDDWELVDLVLRIFAVVVKLDQDFQKEHRDMLQEHLLRIIGSSDCTMPKDVRSAIVLLASSFCNFYGDEFTTLSIPRLLNTLSHSQSTEDAPLCANKCSVNSACQARELSVKVLSESSHLHPSAFSKVATYFLEHMDDNSFNLIYIKCLGRVVELACKDSCDGYSKPDLSSLFNSLSISDKVISLTSGNYKSLMLQCKSASMASGEPVPISGGDNKSPQWEIMCQAATIVSNILRKSNETEQGDAVTRYWNSKVNGRDDIETLLTDFPGILLESILGSARPSVNILLKKELINYILEKVCVVKASHVREFAEEIYIMPYVRLLASFVNKLEGDLLLEYLNEIDAYCAKRLHCKQDLKIDAQTSEASGPEEAVDSTKVNLVNALIWVVKGLAMQGFPQLELWVEKIINFLKNESLGEEVVKRIHYIVADDPFSLNQESFCKYRILYKQRIFLMLVDKLVSGYRSSSSVEIQFNFIRALSSQLKHIPSEILFIKIDSVLPLLVASLKCNSSSQVLLSTLNALSEMMQSPDTNKKLTDYCYDLVPQLARLAQLKDSMNVRRLSLECLRKCARAPSHITLPLRDNVTESLGKCLDDPKRLVRKEAILTRNVWILIGAPGGL